MNRQELERRRYAALRELHARLFAEANRRDALIRELAAKYRVARQTIRAWLRRETAGTLASTKATGRPRGSVRAAFRAASANDQLPGGWDPWGV